MKFTMKEKELKKYSKKLVNLKTRLLPLAIRMSLNDAAFHTYQRSRQNIEREFILRNKFTVNSVRYERARGYNINTMVSATGSLQEYMNLHEFGGQILPKNKFLPIPTLNARISKKYTRKIAKKFSMNKYGDLKKGAKNENFFIKKTKRRKKLAIFQRSPKNTKIKAIRILSDKPQKVKTTHWLKESIVIDRDLNSFFIHNARKLIRERK